MNDGESITRRMNDEELITRRRLLHSPGTIKPQLSRGFVLENNAVVCHKQPLPQFGSSPSMSTKGCLDPALVP